MDALGLGHYYGVLMAYFDDRRAGWVSLTAPDGSIDHTLFADEWTAPGKSLELREGHLAVDWRRYPAEASYPRATLRMLEEFTGLATNAEGQGLAVLRFARVWGLLDLCQHQLPIDHELQQVPSSFATPNITMLPSTPCRSLLGVEPISTWLYWSGQAAAMLRVVLSLRQGAPARPADWATLAEAPPWRASKSEFGDHPSGAEEVAVFIASGAAPVELQRHLASAAIEMWLRLSGVSLSLRWPTGLPEVAFRGGQLLGAVGLGLMLAAVGSGGWVVCPGCGTQHAPAPARGRRPQYCVDCRLEKKPQSAAQARYRATSLEYRESNRRRAQARRAAAKGTRSVK